MIPLSLVTDAERRRPIAAAPRPPSEASRLAVALAAEPSQRGLVALALLLGRAGDAAAD